MRVKKLILQTCYLKTLQEFYSSFLDLPIEIISDKEINVRMGSSELIFVETREANPFYHFAINIPANKIEEARNWLKGKINLLWMNEYDSDIGDFVDWHAKSIYFYDPGGNILELIARFDLTNERDEPFSSNEFLCISEVGLVFNKEIFESKTSQLLHDYSLAYFSKQAPQPQFRAIGDDEGLFIVVPEHRNWYPTDKPAGIFPMSVQFENEGNRAFIQFEVK
jgi:hypothetical protein